MTKSGSTDLYKKAPVICNTFTLKDLLLLNLIGFIFIDLTYLIGAYITILFFFSLDKKNY